MGADFRSKTVIVTGGAKGIGEACARRFAAREAQVVIADIDVEAGSALAADIERSGGVAAFVPTDVSSMAQIVEMVAFARDRFGSVDVLVNNAARALGGKAHEIDEDDWNTVISTNLTSVWRAIRHCVPEMERAGGGAIVNMSSVQSLTGFSGWAAYAAAKGGINALTQQTAIDLAPLGIRVNAVAPGTIMTPLNEEIFRNAPDPEALVRTWNNAHPIGRFGEASEVANAVTFLASEEASFITGSILRVDGGLVTKGE